MISSAAVRPDPLPCPPIGHLAGTLILPEGPCHGFGAQRITRLEALWRSREHLRLDPAVGTSVWLRDHADHHMGVMLNADGPFKLQPG